MTKWFERLTGLADDRPETVHGSLWMDGTSLVSGETGRRMIAGTLDIPTLAQLRAKTVPYPMDEPLAFQECLADVRSLHADPDNAQAVFQVASQFNLLEMISPAVTPENGIAQYAYDKTQGPACAMACAAGTIYRNYFVPVEGQIGQTARRQIDTSADLARVLGAGEPMWSCTNGYLLPDHDRLLRVGKALEEMDRDQLLGKVRVGVQRDTEVTLPDCGHLVTQVYASAVPVSYSGFAAADWEPLAQLVLDAAYEATFRVALENKLKTGNRRLFLTLLGGGAFGNETIWIRQAIARSLELFAFSGLEVILVSYNQPSGLQGVLQQGLDSIQRTTG